MQGHPVLSPLPADPHRARIRAWSDGWVRHTVRPLAIAAAVAVGLGACSGDADPGAATPTSTTTTTADCPDAIDQVDLAYADEDPQQRLDLYRPADAGCAAVPLVVWVHGGGWSIGDKANGMEAKVALWNDAGWAVASVDYRLTDVAAPVADRVVAPTHNEDVAAAIAWLVAEAPRLGLDPERIALLGHSAGAGIVAAVTADPAYLGAHDLEPTTVGCVAPLDTEGFDIATVVAGGGTAASLYRRVFGGDPDGWDDLSPITHVGEADLPATFLVTRGTPDRRAQVAAYESAIEDAGGAVTVVDLPGFSHAEVNQRIGQADDDRLTPALQAFLADCLAPS